MTNKKRFSLSFKQLFIVSSLIAGILLFCDIRQARNWESSKTNTFLKKYEINEYTDLVFSWIKQKLLWVDGQIQDKCPNCQKIVFEFVEPYIVLTGNLAQVFYNVCVNIKESVEQRYPNVLQSVNGYAPGFVEHSQNAISSAWSTSIFYFNRSIDYLSNEVFVGQLSPENMQKAVFEALNTTQHKATEYYHWLFEKVQSAIK